MAITNLALFGNETPPPPGWVKVAEEHLGSDDAPIYLTYESNGMHSPITAIRVRVPEVDPPLPEHWVEIDVNTSDGRKLKHRRSHLCFTRQPNWDWEYISSLMVVKRDVSGAGTPGPLPYGWKWACGHMTCSTITLNHFFEPTAPVFHLAVRGVPAAPWGAPGVMLPQRESGG